MTDQSDRTRAGFKERTRLADARDRLRAAVSPHGRRERVPLASADGRVLAAPVEARRNVPHYEKAAMDGFAVRAEDTFSASERSPAVLEVADDAVGVGEAVRVHTGSWLPERADAVLEDWSYRGDATLEGLHRVEGAYPTLVPGGSVEGRLLETDDIGSLDAYEGVQSGLYVRVRVPLSGADERDGSAAATYVGDPDRLDADATWPGEGPFSERVRAYLGVNDVCVRTSPDRQH